jgi:hypothetical protein
MKNKTTLSPAAKEILAATQFEIDAQENASLIAAAVLRAAADQVVPESTGISYTKQDIRTALLAIADELEAA